MEQYTRRPR